MQYNLLTMLYFIPMPILWIFYVKCSLTSTFHFWFFLKIILIALHGHDSTGIIYAISVPVLIITLIVPILTLKAVKEDIEKVHKIHDLLKTSRNICTQEQCPHL